MTQTRATTVHRSKVIDKIRKETNRQNTIKQTNIQKIKRSDRKKIVSLQYDIKIILLFNKTTFDVKLFYNIF